MSFHSKWTGFLNSLAVFCLFLFHAHMALAENMPASYVVDEAGIIDNTIEQRLAGHLQELEQKTGSQMIVLTVPTTGDIPIEMFALDKAETWKLGQEGKDNGLLMVIAANDRRYRIEVGYGLESILPDSLAGTIARNYLVPRFKAGDYSTGIFETAVVIMDTIAKAQGVELTGMPALQPSRTPAKRSPFGSLISFLFFIFVISSLMNRRSRGLFGGLLLGSMIGNSWSGGSRRSGGFGTGGFGGFGGGMGGGFGGGGVSGGW
ncbi:MAG: TPM domain-containing protein [Deltaproteobacteria bacterium]|nr:TPM domain-containing protein [Deltaproteobacteria bacterium]